MKSFKVEIIIVFLILIASQAIGQNDLTSSSPQYLFKSFSEGRVLMRDNKLHGATMNFNTITESIVFEQNGELLNLTDLDMIHTVYIHDCVFAPVGKVFYEVIESSPIPLFIQHRGKLQPPGTHIGYGAISQVATRTTVSSLESRGTYYNLPLPTDYKVKTTSTYWIINDGEMVSFSNVKDLQRLFPEKKGAIKKFIKKGKLKLNRKEDLVKIVTFIHTDTK